MLQLYHSSFRPLNMFLNRSNKGKRCKTTSDLVPSSKLLWIILGSEATIDTNRPRIKICSNHTHMPYARILIDEIRRLHLWFRQFLSAHRCLYRRRHQAINQRRPHRNKEAKRLARDTVPFCHDPSSHCFLLAQGIYFGQSHELYEVPWNMPLPAATNPGAVGPARIPTKTLNESSVRSTIIPSSSKKLPLDPSRYQDMLAPSLKNSMLVSIHSLGSLQTKQTDILSQSCDGQHWEGG